MTPRDETAAQAAESPPAPAGTARLEAVVRGHVQGVGFRYFVQGRAGQLGLTGWVANEADGAVRLVAEGPRFDLDRLANDLRVGPSGAHVEAVSLRWSAATGGFDRFAVRAGGHSGD